MRLKNNKISSLVALALSAGCALANADSLNGNGTWQAGSWSTSTLVVDSNSPGLGTPYWNNASGDGPKANVGWCLTGGGNCSMAVPAPGALPYYGNGSGAASSMYFTGTGSAVNISLQTLLTTQTTNGAGYDVFGYYLANGSGKAPSAASLIPIFDSRSSTVGTGYTIANVAAGQNYGFYIENIKGQDTPYLTDYIYFMDSASNMATGNMPADALQHFAAFSGVNGTYFLGDVDGDACQGAFTTTNSPCVPSGQFDYNNMMVQVVTNAVPEPASLALMGSSLLVVGAFMRRKKNRAFEN